MTVPTRRSPSEDLLLRLAESIRPSASAEGDLQREPTLLTAAVAYSPSLGQEDSAEAPLLFEAMIESAFLVANADGHFDADERQMFVSLVREISHGRVSDHQIRALIEDLSRQLGEDGHERRLRMIGRTIRADADRMETLRVAALLAHASAGLSQVEHEVLTQLAQHLELTPDSVVAAVRAAEEALRD